MTQGERTRGPNPTGRTPSQPVRSALHGHAQSWWYGPSGLPAGWEPSSGADTGDGVQTTGDPHGAGAGERHRRLPRIDPRLDTIGPGFWGDQPLDRQDASASPQAGLVVGVSTHRHAPMTDHDQRRGLTLRGHVRDDGSRGHVRRREEGLRVAEKAWRYLLGVAAASVRSAGRHSRRS